MTSGTPPASHPDADLLTAFAEQSLFGRERDSVLAHLAQCSDCREIVILASPNLEPVLPKSPARLRWLGWPVLRWGALAACAVVVVAAVSLRPRFEAARSSELRSEVPQAVVKTEPVAPRKTEVIPRLQEDRVPVEYKSRAQSAPQEKPSVVRRDANIGAGSGVGGAALASAPTNKMTLAAKAPAAPPVIGGAQVADKVSPQPLVPAQVNEQVTVTAEAGPVSTESATLGKAKEAPQANFEFPAETRKARSEAVPLAGAPFPSKKLTPRWTLSADGTLQRSLDAGKTWKTIPVAADATLTAVAAMDSDIWVGGSHGTLYHSTDAGDHWTQVVPTAAGQPLTANIIGIEFGDMLHGKVTTANQEVWTTNDAGQTWQAAPAPH